MAKGNEVIDGIQMTLKQSDYPRLSRWAQCNPSRSLIVEERGWRGNQNDATENSTCYH
jgi:hypothetical protein